MAYIPTWAWVLAAAAVIAAIIAGAQYYEAAASLETLLPGVGES